MKNTNHHGYHRRRFDAAVPQAIAAKLAEHQQQVDEKLLAITNAAQQVAAQHRPAGDSIDFRNVTFPPFVAPPGWFRERKTVSARLADLLKTIFSWVKTTGWPLIRAVAHLKANATADSDYWRTVPVLFGQNRVQIQQLYYYLMRKPDQNQQGEQ